MGEKLDKLKTIILATLGGADVLINIVTPILLVFIWIKITGFVDWGSYIFYAVGLLSSIWRAIKIGWMKW